MELKGTDGPTAEHIAWATDASRVLQNDAEERRGRRRGGSHELGEHSALLDLLRGDERLASLFGALNARERANTGP